MKLFEVSLVDRNAKHTYPRLEDGRVVAPPPLAWRANREGATNILDLARVAANFTKTGENDADVNGDGVVDILDASKVAAAPRRHGLDGGCQVRSAVNS